MGESDGFVIPDNYFVRISGLDTRSNFAIYDGPCIVQVYKSLDGERVDSEVQHTIRVGNFSIHNHHDSKAYDFFNMLRKGIEKIVESEESRLNKGN